MAESSSMLALGTSLPNFSLLDVVSGNTFSSDSFGEKPSLVVFICRHCPYVKHVQNELAKIGKDYSGKINMVAVSSNDISSYPEDAPDSLKEQALEVGFIFPYLFDETQKVAKNFNAVCTPDLYLFNKDRKLVYRGQLDDGRPGSDIPVTGKDIRAAIDATLEGRPVDHQQKPSVGCGIKWKS